MNIEESTNNPNGSNLGSSDCSVSFDEFHKLFRQAIDTCPNLDVFDWYDNSYWVAKSLYLLLNNAGEEAVQEHIREAPYFPYTSLEYVERISKDSK